MTLGRNTIMRLSRQYAASESAKKAVVRGSWSVARKSAPSFRMGCGQISQRAALRDGPYELRTTNNEQQKKHWNFPVLFLQESAASYPPRGPPPKYFRRLRA